MSLNPVMVDGTGMCGGCRVHVGTETKFACTDGPEFDAHLVDFDEISKRIKMFQTYEKNENPACAINKRRTGSLVRILEIL